MNNAPTFDFGSTFQLLTGNSPFPWQEDLFSRLVAGVPPAACDIPTGLGKTSVVAVWLIAQATNKELLPRRLVYVINRRTVVDQTTNEVERLRVNLDTKPGLSGLRKQLGQLAVSTLRGQFADNRDWMADPSRPAVIVGTVDMIGSRLLFNGYRAGSWQLARHAGLLGQDALVVHDEAHLEPCFQTLLEWIVRRQGGDGSPRPLCVMALSATGRTGDNRNVLTITDKDREHAVVRQRLSDVRKDLYLNPYDPSTRKLPEQLIELAWRHADAAVCVIVYARLPQDVGKVRDGLHAKLKGIAEAADRVALLTGTIRGHERDLLLMHPAVHGLLHSHDADGHRIAPQHTTWLVATSAGEIGADFDADHLVCDLAPIDSMIQRFGRVNRRGGEGRIARIDVVLDLPKKEKGKDGKEKELRLLDQARLATASLLGKLPPIGQRADDVPAGPLALAGSPAALRDLVREHPTEYVDATSPAPFAVTPHDVVLDAWALTSIQDEWPLCHDVHPYLHGLDEQAPDTVLAWREELDELCRSDGLLLADVKKIMHDVLRHYPLRPQELLSEKPHHVAELLTALRRREPKAWVLLVRQRTLEAQRLEQLPENLNELTPRLHYQTVLLPTSLGGMNLAGMVEVPDPKADEVKGVLDVADLAPSPDGNENVVVRRRVLLSRDEDLQWHSRILAPDPVPCDSLDEQSHDGYPKWTTARDALAKSLGMTYVTRAEVATDDDGPTRMLLLFKERQTRPDSRSDRQVTIAEHSQAARQTAERMAQQLSVEEWIRQVIRVAAGVHDLGKADLRWQRAIGNNDLEAPLAKSFGRGLNWHVLNGYRHEFGSLRAVVSRLSELPSNEARDLVLHLTAAHHGRGRPHFDLRATVGPPDLLNGLSELLRPAQIARRFARLQRRFGHWGLAWLEAILMAADAEGSAASVPVAPDEVEEEEE